MQAPGLIDDGKGANRERARTEVVASAFAEVADDYFSRQKQLEDRISNAEERARTRKLLAAGAGLLGLLIAVVAFETMGVSGAIFGVLVGLVGGGIGYHQYQTAIDEAETARHEKRSDEPDGRVTFVSQVGVPMNLLPYGDGHLLFDGLDQAPERTLDLADIEGNALLDTQQDLVDFKRSYDQTFGGEAVASPDLVKQFAPDAEEHGQPERPLVEQLEEMTAIVRASEPDQVEADVWANDQKTESVQELLEADLLVEGDCPMVETEQSIEESKATVDEIRGVEQEAVSGDMLEQAKSSRDTVDELASDVVERLRDTEGTVEDHYDSYSDRIRQTNKKFVCEECLDERVRTVTEELGLVDEILSSESGSLGTALSDPDLNQGLDEDFRGQIREDIASELPHLHGELRRAFNRLTDLDGDDGYCESHGDVDTVPVADSGALFGEVWRSLYYDLRDPIMDSVADLEKDAEDVRQQKEQKMMDLTQYEQIKDRLERRYQETKSEYEAAKSVERQL